MVEKDVDRECQKMAIQALIALENVIKKVSCRTGTIIQDHAKNGDLDLTHAIFSNSLQH